MKKRIVLIFILVFVFYGLYYLKTYNMDTKKSENNLNETVQNQGVNIETLDGIFIKNDSLENSEFIIFNKNNKLKSHELKDYLSKKIEENNIDFNLLENEIFKIEIFKKTGQIKNMINVDEIEGYGKYVGLIDSNSAEFQYNGYSFMLKVDENILQSIENIDENAMLKLKIRKPSVLFEFEEI